MCVVSKRPDPGLKNIYEGLFTWREKDPSTRKILEGETTFRLVYMQKVRSEWLPIGEGKEKNCRPLEAERSAAAILFFFVPSNSYLTSEGSLHGARIFLVLGSSYLSARKILSLGRS